MKLNFQYSEEEKKAILEQHNFYKKVLQSKVKRLMVNEQVEGEEITTPTGKELLLAAIQKKCPIAVGGELRSSPGKPSILYKKADYDSANGYFKIGDELYIKGDYTFDIVKTDASGNQTKTVGKTWTCKALKAEEDAKKKETELATKQKEDADAAAASAPINQNIKLTQAEGNWKPKKDLLSTDTEQNIENPVMYEKKVVNGVALYRRKTSGRISSGLTTDQKSIIDDYEKKGYKLRDKLTPEEAKTFKSEIVSPASEGYFSQDLVMYFDPTTLQAKVSVTSVIQDAVDSRIPKDKKDCKQTIEAYYISFKKKRPLTPNEFNALKTKTQACKNEFYQDWGTFGGGTKTDEILDMMLGKQSGGPSSYGDDSKWRIQ
jgi:hypothetical protein